MHYAKLDKSPRLQRVLALLRDGQWHGTLDIVEQAFVCAVNSAIAEIRQNGYMINCRKAARGRYEYQLIADTD